MNIHLCETENCETKLYKNGTRFCHGCVIKRNKERNRRKNERRRKPTMREQIADLKAALVKIGNINNGPDRGSGEWRATTAATIATEALEKYL